MDVLFNRYRNLTVLVVAIVAQLALLAYQVRDDHDVRLLRVWSVGAVSPVARLLEYARSGTSTFFKDYFFLMDTRQENLRLKQQRDSLLLENQQMRAELSLSERAHDLAIFQQHSPQTTLAARIIGDTTGGNISGSSSSRVKIVDRGSADGIAKGMAVIVPAGIVGKVIQVYPNACFVMLITDPAFAGGVISQKNHVRGRAKGQGSGTLLIDGIQPEQGVEVGDWFYTSGDDLIFPRGLQLGRVASVRPGNGRQEVFVTPSGFENGLDEVLIVTRGIHELIPAIPDVPQPVVLQSSPEQTGQLAAPVDSGRSGDSAAKARPVNSGTGTDADRVMQSIRSKSGSQSSPPEATAPASPAQR